MKNEETTKTVSYDTTNWYGTRRVAPDKTTILESFRNAESEIDIHRKESILLRYSSDIFREYGLIESEFELGAFEFTTPVFCFVFFFCFDSAHFSDSSRERVKRKSEREREKEAAKMQLLSLN